MPVMQIYDFDGACRSQGVSDSLQLRFPNLLGAKDSPRWQYAQKAMLLRVIPSLDSCKTFSEIDS